MSDGEHITTTSDERLVVMANQIARFFASQPGDTAAADTAKHIADFWDPRMRTRIRAYVSKGGAGLDSVARAAVDRLQK